MERIAGTRYFLTKDAEWKETPDGVRYQQVMMTPGDPGRPMLVLSDLPAGFREPPHTHDSSYVEIVIEGAITVGKTRMEKGDIRAITGGTGYGPLVTGPEGCLRLTIFDRADGSLTRLLGREA